MSVRCAKFDRLIADARCVETQKLRKPVCWGCKEGKTASAAKAMSRIYTPSPKPPIPSDMQMLSSSPQVAQLLYDLELLLKAQTSYIFQLAHEGRLNEAIARLGLADQAVKSSLYGDGNTPSACRPLSQRGRIKYGTIGLSTETIKPILKS